MANQNNTTQRPSNPFAPPKNNQSNNSGSSRFGAGSSRFGSNNNNNSGSSRFASRFGSRNTQENIEWTIAPMAKEVVGISLTGLGDPFHRLLGRPLNPAYSDPKKVIEALSQDAELLEEVKQVLDDTWEKFNFRGVAMVYPMNEGIRAAYTQPLQPLPPPPPKEEKSDNEEEYVDDSFAFDNVDNSTNQSTLCLRAIDLPFVLNILARVRANVVIGNTPLALETGFLDQTILCDDPRIVNLARATGCIEEAWD